MLQGLARCDAVIRVVHEELHNEVLDVATCVRNEFDDAGSVHLWEVELHVRGVLLEIIEERLLRRSQNVMYLVHLVDFVIAWEERKERYYFKEDASHAPEIHLISIVPICKQAFRRSVPPGGDVLCVRLLGVDAPAGAEVS